MGRSNKHEQTTFRCYLDYLRRWSRYVQLPSNQLWIVTSSERSTANCKYRQKCSSQILVVQAGGAGRTEGIPPEKSGFENFLKQYRAWKSASIVAVEKVELPARVETHMD